MANFLLLYTGGSMPESPAEQEAVMQHGVHGSVKSEAIL